MKKQTFDIKAEAKEHIIKDISKIYYFTYKSHSYAYVLKAVKYNARTDKGFKALIRMVEKLGKNSKDTTIQYCYKNIQILKVLFKE